MFVCFQPGLFKECQAIGWWLAEANLAQVSINLTDMDQTLVHQVFEECKKKAEVTNYFLLFTSLLFIFDDLFLQNTEVFPRVLLTQTPLNLTKS